MSDWIVSVAAVLPLPHRADLPYTLGDAIAELGAYAHAVGTTNWTTGTARVNRSSLRTEITAQSATLGSRLSTLLAPLLDDLRDDTDPVAITAAATRFDEAWHAESGIAEAFGDLCEAAQAPGATSCTLRKLSAIIASQVGPAARGPFSPLSHAAQILVATEEDLARMPVAPLPEPLTEAGRVKLAEKTLVSAPTGRVTAWVVYHRAIVSAMRTVAGTMTFLRAAWALPSVFDNGPNDFPERAELHEIRKDVPWLDDLHAEALKPETRLALVRVDLGERQLAGAVEEARRRVEAILSIAVEAGGVSWQYADACAVLLDGKVRSSSLGLTLQDSPASGDTYGRGATYGMGATAEMLTNIADQLGDALAKGPMPEHLVEALTALREARMTDHREVLFHGARRVTRRVATALEDHAMELIASVLKVHPKTLADALQQQEAVRQVSRRVASQIMAPFNNAWAWEQHEARRTLERKISSYSNECRTVSVPEAVSLQAEIRALPMSELQRADLEDALVICTDPVRERQVLDELLRETALLRSRHRRVRNAVNHGLPLRTTTLNSVREYADETSRAALEIALTCFKNGDPGEMLVQQHEDTWAARSARIEHGVSWAVEDGRIDAESESPSEH